MSVPRPPASADDATTVLAGPAKQTLSQFVAGILDQLSVSAWLPAGALVGLLLLVGSVRSAEGNVGCAVTRIGDMSIEAVILLLAAAIVTTVLTQAFQYEAIQLIEGYWGPRWLPATIGGWLARRHLRIRDDLRRRYDDAMDRAWGLARTRMLKASHSEETVATVEQLVRGEGVRSPQPEARRLALGWLDFATHEERRHIDALAAALRWYPRKGHLVQPTRFGNTIRAYEERVHELRGAAPLERFVQTVWHELPTNVQQAHGQLRARLDLYCTLLVVVVISGVIAIAAFAELGTTLLAVTALLTIAGTWLIYRAAITSARAYGTILTTIAELAPRGKRATQPPSSTGA